jgi:hypothetical protein
MMNRAIIWIFIFTVAVGCKKEKAPEGILSEGEMVQVLMQLYLAEERFSRISITYDSSVNLMPHFRNRVFAETGVPDSLYRMSMEYYMANPKKLEFIYSALVDSLGLKEQRRQVEQTTPDALPQ